MFSIEEEEDGTECPHCSASGSGWLPCGVSSTRHNLSLCTPRYHPFIPAYNTHVLKQRWHVKWTLRSSAEKWVRPHPPRTRDCVSFGQAHVCRSLKLKDPIGLLSLDHGAPEDHQRTKLFWLNSGFPYRQVDMMWWDWGLWLLQHGQTPLWVEKGPLHLAVALRSSRTAGAPDRVPGTGEFNPR